MIYQIFGGAIAIFALSLLFGRILFRKFELKKKVVLSVTVSFVLSTILSGFGAMDGGSYNPQIITYFSSSLIVLILWFGWIFLKNPRVEEK